MKKALPLPVSLILLLIACDREPKQYHLPQGIKTYFGYKEGSSWIYRDSVKGSIDSFALSNVYSGYITGKPTWFNAVPGNRNEYLSLNMRDYSVKHGDWIQLKITNNKDYCSSDLNYGGKYFPLFTSGWPFALISTDTSIQKELLSNVVINGRSYNYVYHYTYRRDSIHTDELLIDVDHGLIKLAVGADSTRKILELQRSNIIR